ncbi:MAG: hypothetical protein IRZ07_26760 [Microbispora sp.]|nr:hypothetical protein [Microbispora sp.]
MSAENLPPQAQSTTQLLRRLIELLHEAHTTPPDDNPLQTVQGRVAAYGRLRERGFTRKQAAWHVGVCIETARRYEIRLRNQKENA